MQKYCIFIGIDMSKKWFDACIVKGKHGKKFPHHRFENSQKGFANFHKWVSNYARKNDLQDKRFVCLEHMGLYTLPLCQYLQQRQIDFVLEHPLQILQSVGIRRGKSDPADAADIAAYLYKNRETLNPSKLSCDNLLKIKKLLGYRQRLVRYKSGLKTAAKEMISFTSPTVHQDVCRSTEQVVRVMETQISNVEEQISRTISQDKELQRLYDLVNSVKGAGFIISATLLVYTNAFTAFNNPRQFACYVGFAPFSRTSGSCLDQPPKVSHMANKKLKALISNGVMSAIRYDQQLRAFYLKKIKEGKNKFSVQNAVKNKFIHRVFAVVKRGTPYVELGAFNAQ